MWGLGTHKKEARRDLSTVYITTANRETGEIVKLRCLKRWFVLMVQILQFLRQEVRGEAAFLFLATEYSCITRASLCLELVKIDVPGPVREGFIAVTLDIHFFSLFEISHYSRPWLYLTGSLHQYIRERKVHYNVRCT